MNEPCADEVGTSRWRRNTWKAFSAAGQKQRANGKHIEMKSPPEAIELYELFIAKRSNGQMEPLHCTRTCR